MPDDLHQNPYQSFGQSDPISTLEDLPEGMRSSVPRVIGTLNILFGVALGLCGLCQGFSLFSQSVAAPKMQQLFQQQQDELQQQIDELQLQIDQEIDDQTSQEIAAKIEAVTEEIEVLKIMPNPMMIWSLDKSYVVGFFTIECVFALLLNLFMFISGVGLLSFNEWGRKMALWVVMLKLVNIVIVAVFVLTIVVPAMVESMQEFMLQAVQEQEVLEPVRIGEIQNSMLVGTSIAISIFAAVSAIYPIICLWQLNRSLVKKSCQTKVATAS
jgi:DNA-binding transcriptional MerR regulator